MKLTFLLSIPTHNASSASRWPRPGRKPYENPRKSSSQITFSTVATALSTVFKRGDRERMLHAIFLRDVAPTGRQRPLRSRLDPRVQVLNTMVEAPFVSVPCHVVDGGRHVTLQRVKRRPQHVGFDMMSAKWLACLLPYRISASILAEGGEGRFTGQIVCYRHIFNVD